MSQATKFYVSSGDAKLVVLAESPAVAASDLILRVLRDSFAVQFGKTVFVDQQGFRDDNTADDDTTQYETFLIFLCAGIISAMTSREYFEHFFHLNEGGHHGNQDEISE